MQSLAVENREQDLRIPTQVDQDRRCGPIRLQRGNLREDGAQTRNPDWTVGRIVIRHLGCTTEIAMSELR